MVRLGFTAAVIAEKMIGADPQTGLLGLLIVLCKIRIHIGTPFGGFDKSKGDVLRG